MAVAFRSSASVTNGTATASVVVSKPAGAAAGDQLIAFVAEVSNPSITGPAGWTLIGTVASTSTMTINAYRYLATGTDPASWTWTLGGAVPNWGWIGAYSGVDPAAPVSASGSNAFSSGGTVFQPGLAQMPRFGLGLSAVAAVRPASGTATTWTPSGTERADLSTNIGSGTDIAGEVQDTVNSTTAAANYGPTLTASQSQSSAAGWVITLNPLFTFPLRSAQVSVTVEAAFGADLTADSSTWTWTDISTRLMGDVVITRGKTDRTGTTQPTQMGMRLNNADGALTPRQPSSLWFGQWGRGTPVRAWVNLPIGRYLRAQGRVGSIAPTWPADNDEFAYVDVIVSGVLRVLGQRSTPPKSSLYRTIIADKPYGYWPCEDSSGSTVLAEASGGPQALYFGDVTLASGGPAGSSPVLSLGSASLINATFTASSSATAWSFEFYMNVPSTPGTDSTIVDWVMPASTLPHWRFTIFASGNIGLEAFTAASVRQVDSETAFTYNGVSGLNTDTIVTVTARQNGGNIEYEWIASGPVAGTGASGSIAGTIGAINNWTKPGLNHSGWKFGHVSVWDRTLDTSWGSLAFFHSQALNGYLGDTAVARVQRAAALAPVSITYRGSNSSTSAAMGPIPINTPLEGMREAELADLGILSDGFADGVAYLSGQDRYNLTTTMALDTNLGQVKVGFAPVEDDRYLVNGAAVNRSGGSSATYHDPTSPKLEGEYTAQVTLNLQDDTTLLNQASFRTSLGVVAQMRVPLLTINLRDSPELIRQWLAMDLGLRYTAINLMSQYVPGTLDQVLDYYVETLSAVTWSVQTTGSPFAPWRIFQLAATSGDTGEFVGHLDTDNSALNADITATATSIAVKTNSGPLWTTTADDFPFDINVDGERMRVTNITGSSSPQTFTVARGVDGYSAAHLANDAVSLWQPLVLGL